MKIYNTLTRKKEEFVPVEEGKVRMYNSTGIFIGIYEFRREKNMYCPAAIFCTPEDFAGKTKETT